MENNLGIRHLALKVKNLKVLPESNEKIKEGVEIQKTITDVE